MYTLLSRIVWIVSLLVGFSLIIWENDLFVFGVIATLVTRFIILPDSLIKKACGEKGIDMTAEKENENYTFSSHYEMGAEKKTDVDIEKDELSFEKETPLAALLGEQTQEEQIEEISPEIQKPQKNIPLVNWQQEEQKYTQNNDAPSALKKFFSENILAKLGGILVFLGVVFLLALVYINVGPWEKIAIGFAIGFCVYIAGYILDTKGFSGEARILLGISILINYAVILGGRYLVGNGDFLDVGLTFFMLIANTFLGIFTGLFFRSRTLLFFSFIFAYLNPFLLGTSSEEPYTLLGYTMIVTLASFFFSYQRKDPLLFFPSFVFAAVLFLAAPWQDSMGWTVKLICIDILGSLGLFVGTRFEQKYQNLHEMLIGASFFLIGFMGLLNIEGLESIHIILLSFSSLSLMGFCYFFSHRKSYLYSVGTFCAAIILVPALIFNGRGASELIISEITILIFMLLNLSYPLFQKKAFLQESAQNIIAGLMAGVFFITPLTLYYGDLYFPGVWTGLVFILISLIYTALSYRIFQIFGFDTLQEEKNTSYLFYGVCAMALSLFTFAIALCFSKYTGIIGLIWFLESSVLFFLARKIRNIKVLSAALVLMFLGLGRLLFTMMNAWKYENNYLFLILLVGEMSLLLLNLYFLVGKKGESEIQNYPPEYYKTHHILHVIGMCALFFFSLEVLQFSSEWYNAATGAIFIFGLGYIYHQLQSPGLQKMQYFTRYGIIIWHILLILSAFSGIEEVSYVFSGIIWMIAGIPLVIQYRTQKKITDIAFFSSFLIYSFLISTLLLYIFFEMTFFVTLYWGTLTFILLGYGIQKEIQVLRTLGLYLMVLTMGKIFLYDIWLDTLDTVSRIIVFIVIGILMIILSSMYSKKYGKTLGKEFDIENIFPKDIGEEKKSPEKSESYNFQVPQKSEISQIQKDIEDMNFDSTIIGVRMYISGTEKPIQIRAQNLIKIAKLIEETLHKNEFSPGELSEIYTLVTQNYKSTLPADQYKKIEDIVSQFVKHGGKMEFVRK